MGGGGKGGGGGDQTVTVRYAGYIESYHKQFLAIEWDWVDVSRNISNKSPFAGYDPNDAVGSPSKTPFSALDFADGFFGVGYTLASYPSLYDMYGKFIAGLDVDVLFNQIFIDTVNSPNVATLVQAESALMDDDLEANSYPRFEAGMRDINAVVSSTFVIGEAMIEDGKTKALAKFSSELQYKLIPVAVERWKMVLDWDLKVVQIYNTIITAYFGTAMNITGFNYDMLAKNSLWPFTILEYMRAALGALQGATNTQSTTNVPTWQKIASGALTIMGLGSMMSQPA
jgi:hypothetical protein